MEFPVRAILDFSVFSFSGEGSPEAAFGPHTAKLGIIIKVWPINSQKKIQPDPRKMEVGMLHDVRQYIWHQIREISVLGHGRCTSNRPKSGYARPFGIIFVLGAAHVHGEQVGHLTSDPPPLSDTAMAVRVQKHNFQEDLLTHPTNPEVAACRVPVFGLRFVVSVFPVYRVNLASGFRIFRALFLYE